jgi:hypothetical protein
VSDLLKQVLTDVSARDGEGMKVVAAAAANEYSPWSP